MILIFHDYTSTYYIEPNEVAFINQNKAFCLVQSKVYILFFFNMGKSILYTLLYVLMLLMFKSWSCCISVNIEIYPSFYS